MTSPPANPILYSPDLETVAPDEAETQQKIIAQILKISEITYKDDGHAMRGVHAKSHGILKGRLIVPQGLPPVLAQGLFATPGTHDAIFRFSTSPGDILDDSVSTPRGFALKVFGAEGPRLPGSDGATTQDFVLVNGKAFLTPTPKAFAANLGLLAATTNKAEGLKKVLSAVLRGAETVVEAFGGESGTLIGLGGHAETNILGDSFFSHVPIRFGDYVAKIGIRPLSPELKALTDAHLHIDGVPNALRDEVKRFFAGQGGEWELVAQLSVGGEAMPIEDASKAWPEDQSPYVQIARLIASPQDSWNEATTPKLNDALAFSPWHGLAAHQPLGGVMRVRKAVYEASQSFRLTRTGCPMHEPAGVEAVGI